MTFAPAPSRVMNLESVPLRTQALYPPTSTELPLETALIGPCKRYKHVVSRSPLISISIELGVPTTPAPPPRSPEMPMPPKTLSPLSIYLTVNSIERYAQDDTPPSAISPLLISPIVCYLTTVPYPRSYNMG